MVIWADRKQYHICDRQQTGAGADQIRTRTRPGSAAMAPPANIAAERCGGGQIQTGARCG
jgi:hypothetical protein